MNNAGAALMPRPVANAIRDHITLEEQIGGYEASDAKSDAITAGYADVAALIGAQPRNIAVVANATAAFVQAMSSFDFEPGDTIITSRCDYTSNQIQYLALRDRLGVVIRHAQDLFEGGIDANSVRMLARDALAKGQKVVVAISWIPTNSGLVQDVESVGRVCEELDVPYIVDACQAVGQMVIDAPSIRCDYLACTARKFLRGPRGIGFLYASDRALARGDQTL
jgi:selenocysteine lyase/cysteine desulfurase